MDLIWLSAVIPLHKQIEENKKEKHVKGNGEEDEGCGRVEYVLLEYIEYKKDGRYVDNARRERVFFGDVHNKLGIWRTKTQRFWK